MSTALERLRALTAAKKAAEAATTNATNAEGTLNDSTQPTPSQTLYGTGHSNTGSVSNPDSSGDSKTLAVSEPRTEQHVSVPTRSSSESESVVLASVQSEPRVQEPEVTAQVTPTRSTHPLMMELAELEQALIEKLPEFKTILRDIHSKLRQDTALVAALSEEEIELIVTGLTRHASMEIIAPKAAKAASKAKKVPISAADL